MGRLTDKKGYVLLFFPNTDSGYMYFCYKVLSVWNLIELLVSNNSPSFRFHVGEIEGSNLGSTLFVEEMFQPDVSFSISSAGWTHGHFNEFCFLLNQKVDV